MKLLIYQRHKYKQNTPAGQPIITRRKLISEWLVTRSSIKSAYRSLFLVPFSTRTSNPCPGGGSRPIQCIQPANKPLKWSLIFLCHGKQKSEFVLRRVFLPHPLFAFNSQWKLSFHWFIYVVQRSWYLVLDCGRADCGHISVLSSVRYVASVTTTQIFKNPNFSKY